MNFKEEIFKSIQDMVDRAVVNSKVDRTFKTVIKGIAKNGYIILDQAGSERIVKCCIPDIKLRIGQVVYVKMMQGQIKDMHICGIV